jgi:hypothetical protein
MVRCTHAASSVLAGVTFANPPRCAITSIARDQPRDGLLGVQIISTGDASRLGSESTGRFNNYNGGTKC